MDAGDGFWVVAVGRWPPLAAFGQIEPRGQRGVIELGYKASLGGPLRALGGLTHSLCKNRPGFFESNH